MGLSVGDKLALPESGSGTGCGMERNDGSENLAMKLLLGVMRGFLKKSSLRLTCEFAWYGESVAPPIKAFRRGVPDDSEMFRRMSLLFEAG